MMFTKSIRAAAVILMAAWGDPMLAADIEMRPDLRDHLREIYPIYGGPTASGEPVYSADTDINKDDYTAEIIKLSGAINVGDEVTLRALTKGDGFYYVALDSPGGNFLEGIRIGELFQELRGGNGDPQLRGVIVLAGDNCLSACALAFALAALPRDVGTSVRFIEDGGTLGFHMGFLPEKLSSQTAAVRDAMNLSYDVVARFVQLIRGGVTPPALLENTLYHRSAQSFYYVNADLLARYFGFVPVTRNMRAWPLFASALSMDNVARMCEALRFSRPGHPMTADEYEWFLSDFEGQSPLPAGLSLQEATKRLGSLRIATPECTVEIRANDTVGLVAAPASPRTCVSADSSGWCAVPLDEYSTAVHNATVGLLGDVYGCHYGVLTRKAYHWDSQNRFDDAARKVAPDDINWQRQVERDVNLRDIPSLDGGKLGQVTAGTEVTVTDCRMVPDNQGLWMQITTPASSGWVSARFLQPQQGVTRYVAH